MGVHCDWCCNRNVRPISKVESDKRMNASDVKRYLGYGGGVLIIGLMVLGKIKLATMKPVWWVIILGGIVFAISSPASANAQSER
jgi:hypothetical protein